MRKGSLITDANSLFPAAPGGDFHRIFADIGRSEIWRNPEAVEDRVADKYQDRCRRGLKFANPDPLDPREQMPPSGP